MRILGLLCMMFLVAFAGCGAPKQEEEVPLTPEEIAAQQEKERQEKEAARLETGNKAVDKTRGIMKKVVRAIELFKLDYNRYPATLGELEKRPADIAPEVWRGPYYTASCNDAWGKPLIYREPGTGDFPYDLVSLGEDSAKGGEEFGKDLTNHD